MGFSEPHQLQLPSTFPLEAFTRFYQEARARLARPSEQRHEFNAACNLVGWRFRGATEYANAILESWAQGGADASFEVQYARERDLYGMFSCGVASLEATCYACHALLAALSPAMFPFDEGARRKSSAKWLGEQLAAKAPGDALTQCLRERLSSPEWKLWGDFRNTMTHRANIPRITYGAVGTSPPPARLLAFADRWSHGALAGDEAEFRSLLTWLSEAMRDVMMAATSRATAT